jgi:hypothetical protein
MQKNRWIHEDSERAQLSGKEAREFWSKVLRESGLLSKVRASPLASSPKTVQDIRVGKPEENASVTLTPHECCVAAEFSDDAMADLGDDGALQKRVRTILSERATLDIETLMTVGFGEDIATDDPLNQVDVLTEVASGPLHCVRGYEYSCFGDVLASLEEPGGGPPPSSRWHLMAPDEHIVPDPIIPLIRNCWLGDEQGLILQPKDVFLGVGKNIYTEQARVGDHTSFAIHFAIDIKVARPHEIHKVSFDLSEV